MSRDSDRTESDEYRWTPGRIAVGAIDPGARVPVDLVAENRVIHTMRIRVKVPRRRCR